MKRSTIRWTSDQNFTRLVFDSLFQLHENIKIRDYRYDRTEDSRRSTNTFLPK